MTVCAQQEFYIHGDTNTIPTKDKTQSFFVSGIGQSQDMDAAAICGGADKIVKVQTQKTFGNLLVGMLSAGIYTPRAARVYCSK